MSTVEDLREQTPFASEDQGRETLSKATRSDTQFKGPGFRPRPLQVTWEMTRDCDWKAASARTTGRTRHDRSQFSTAEAFHLIEEVAAMHVPLLALTGGDPLCRPDLFPVIEFASRHSVRTSLTVQPTPKLDATVIAELKELGLMRLGLWLHGSTAALHDAHCGMSGLQRRTLEIIEACHEVQLPVQVNTIVARRNLHDIDPMFELLTHLDVALWNVFFFVPGTPEQRDQMLDAEETEKIFAQLYAGSGRSHFQVRTSEGQHYQRFILQQRAREARIRFLELEAVRYAADRVTTAVDLSLLTAMGRCMLADLWRFPPETLRSKVCLSCTAKLPSSHPCETVPS